VSDLRAHAGGGWGEKGFEFGDAGGVEGGGVEGGGKGEEQGDGAESAHGDLGVGDAGILAYEAAFWIGIRIRIRIGAMAETRHAADAEPVAAA
jgi:hypothetical protein